MSDLQCAVTVLLVRHAEAVPDGPGRVGDEDRPLTPRGHEQARALGEALRDRRVAAVYTSGLRPARATAEEVADVLGLPAQVVRGAQELSVVLDDLRDLHRGETVVLVTHGGLMTVAVARLCQGAAPDLAGTTVPSAAVAEIAGDADGWTLVGWPGVPSGEGR